jgi:hypothetical protein
VQLVITDANGVGRGKNIAREELGALYGSGRNVAGSILGLDVTGEDVEETGLVWSAGDADLCCRPVPGSLWRAPWLERPTAQVLGTMFELDGRPAGADPRHVLARVVNRRGHGLTPVVAVNWSSTCCSGRLTGGCCRRAACGLACAVRASTPMVSAVSTTCRRCSTISTHRRRRWACPCAR